MRGAVELATTQARPVPGDGFFVTGEKVIATDRFFISTTIPYVNGRPHIGHALEFVQTDTFARYHRLRGDETYALTGTDENALKNVQSAEKEGIATRELVDRNSEWFRALARDLNFDFDQFIRTAADPKHAAGAEKLWRAVEHSGDLYKKYYAGLYCLGCEAYYSEADLHDGLCPEHETRPELIEEENFFFRLSRYAGQLRDLIASDRLRVIPETRKNEVLSFIDSGLQDFSVSRSEQRAKGWGIRVPDDPSQVMYVWFDALTNYITALDYATDGDLYRHFWLNNPHRVHALGKGVIRFHAIYWPAMLLSAGLPLPETVFVHGYVNIAGRRVGKSMGNAIDPAKLIETYGSEAVRYYLLRSVSATGDHNYTTESFEARYNADLANDLGNLLNRTVSMIGRYRDGVVPSLRGGDESQPEIANLPAIIFARVASALDSYDPQLALEAIWELVSAANKYVEESAPWTVSKRARQGDATAETRLDNVLHTLAESVRVMSVLLEPLLPGTAARMGQQLGVGLEASQTWSQRAEWGASSAGSRVANPEPIFPRLDPGERPA